MKLCAIDRCTKPTGIKGTAKGLCSMHYTRLMRNGDPAIRFSRSYEKTKACRVEGCDQPRAGRGWCINHWTQWKRRGDPEAPSLRGRAWTISEIARLELILNARADGLGWCDPYERQELAILLERTESAVASKLVELRQARRQMQKSAQKW